MNRLLTTGIVLLGLLSSAQAGKEDPTWDPPRRHNHPYNGELIEYRVPQPQVVDLCKKIVRMASGTWQVTDNQHGCAVQVGHDRCIIVYVNQTFMAATPEAVRRHELGHCNGWSSAHPK